MEKDRTTVKLWVEREGAVQVPAGVKSHIHPVPFFPDVVLRVSNIAVSCVALSMFFTVCYGRIHLSLPWTPAEVARIWQVMNLNWFWLHICGSISGKVLIQWFILQRMSKLCNKPACLLLSFF